MTVIKFLVFIRARRAIETHLFVASFIIVFPIAVSSFHHSTVRLIFLYSMGRFRIIRRYEKESWIIRMGGKITNRPVHHAK